MRLSYFPKSAARNSAPVIAALLQGFRLHGIQTDLESRNSDMVLLWSQLWAGRMQANRMIYQHYRDRNRPVVVIDVGMIQRNHTWKIMLDGDAALAGPGHDRERRDRLGLTLAPWRTQGRHIVMALQRPDSNQWADQPDLDAWLADTLAKLRRHSQRPVLVRPHPRFPIRTCGAGVVLDTPKRIGATYDDYDFDRCLDDAWVTVNWNSTPGVISVLRGLPALVGHTSLAAPVANLDWSMVENPSQPDREQWANDLAWTEWTLQEITAGIPQRLLLDRLLRQ